MDNNLRGEGQDTKRTSKEVVDIYYDDKPYFRYLYKKTEKIILAVYLVTNLFTDREPLKWELRKISSPLLSRTLSFNTRDLEVGVARDLLGKFMELESWLLIANQSLFLSDMNYTILKKELDGLMALLAELEVKQSPEKNVGLSENFFKDNSSLVLGQSPFLVDERRPFVDTTSHKGHPYKGHSKMSLTSVMRGRLGNSKRENILPKNSSQANGDRRNLIIGLLQKKALISVKDVADVISGCSEKTLQRELLGMVKDGVLVKEGERRWSRYKMA